jgi:hypothetical protein
MFQLNISSKTQHGTCVLMLSFNLSLQTRKVKITVNTHTVWHIPTRFATPHHQLELFKKEKQVN